MVNPIQAYMQGVVKLFDTSTGKNTYQKATSGAAHTRIAATDVTDPHDSVKQDSVTLAAGQDLVISNFEGYKTLQFTVSGITTGVYQLKLGYDTDNPPTLTTSEVAILDLSDVTTGGGVKTVLSTGDDGDYVLTDICANSVFFEFQSGTDTPTITYVARKS